MLRQAFADARQSHGARRMDTVSWCWFCDYLEWGGINKNKTPNKKEATMWINAGRKRIKRLKGKEVRRMQMEGIFPLSAILPLEKEKILISSLKNS